jgi:hypothetical protein
MAAEHRHRAGMTVAPSTSSADPHPGRAELLRSTRQVDENCEDAAIVARIATTKTTL